MAVTCAHVLLYTAGGLEVMLYEPRHPVAATLP